VPEAADRRALSAWYAEHDGDTRASLLRWYRTVGYARHDEVSAILRERPALAGDDIVYLPGVETTIDEREMTAEEVALAQRLLVQMAEDARDALAGHSTLAVVLHGG